MLSTAGFGKIHHGSSAGRLPRLLLLMAGLALCVAGPAAAQQKSGKGGGKKRPPTVVVVAPVKALYEAPKAEYTGLIQPADKALLSSDVAGRLVSRSKKAGDLVKKNEVLARLENSTLKQDLAVMRAGLKETQAQVALSEQQQRRLTSLYKKNLATAQQFEDGQANLAVIKAKLEGVQVQVERLEDQVNRLVIRSPIRGQVISANGETGQWITQNLPLFEIFNYEQFELMVGLPGRFMPSVRNRGPVKVAVPEIGNRLTGKIVGVIRHVDATTGNFRIRILIDNPKGLPLSGLLAKVRLPIDKARNQLTVPRDAIVRRGKGTFVALVNGGKAKVVPVRIIGNRGDAVIVSGKGLTPKAQVVVRGNERLFSGMPVRASREFSGQGNG